MDAANIRNVFQARYDRKPSTWSKIGIPHEDLENIDLDLVVSRSFIRSESRIIMSHLLEHSILNSLLSIVKSRW
jgi:hypothetical protein